MENISFIKTSFEYYDKNKEIFDNLYKNIFYFKIIIIDNDMENNIIIFYDLDKNEIFRSRYEILSIYNKLNKIWIWSWAYARYSKKETTIARKIFNYGISLNLEVNNYFLKTELITSRFKITHNIQLDIHLSIASYLSKNKFIFNINYIYGSEFDNKYNLLDKNSSEFIYIFLLDYEELLNSKK